MDVLELFSDMEKAIEKIRDDTQKLIDEKFHGMLWVSEPRYKNYFLFYGTYFDVKQLFQLVNKRINFFGNDFNLQSYCLDKHGKLEIIDAKEKFKIEFRPRMGGDIIEYQGVQYEVSGFTTDDKIAINKIENDGNSSRDTIFISKNEPYTMIYSKYFDYHIKDRVKRLFQ